MSILKVAAINHPSAGSGGLAIGTDGNVSGAGMDLIVSQSFTAASTVSIDGCFTSEYDNYRVVASFQGSAAADHYFRLRASGVDDSSSNYWYTVNDRVGAYLAPTSVSGLWAYGYGSATTKTTASFDIVGPAAAVQSSFSCAGSGEKGGRTYPGTWFSSAGVFASTASFDGFTIYPSSGTITGTLRVYGYRN